MPIKNPKAIAQKIFGRLGMSCSTLKIVKKGYSEDVRLFVKCANTSYFLKISQGSSLANLVYWYLFAEKHRIKAPKLIYYDLQNSKYKYYVREYLNGDSSYELSKRKKYEAGYFAGKELRKLHRIKVNGFGGVDSEFNWKHRTWLSALQQERKKHKDTAALKILSRREIDAIDTLTIFNNKIDVSNSRFMHGDLYDENVLYIKRLKQFAIIDPGVLIGGDPMYDLAYSTVPRKGGEPFEKGIKAGYSLDAITKEERYRFRMLRLLCLFNEAVEYVAANDSKLKIDLIVRTLRRELEKV